MGVTETFTIGGSYDTSIGDRQIAFVAAQTMILRRNDGGDSRD